MHLLRLFKNLAAIPIQPHRIRENKFQCILVIWGKFYEVVHGWQADFELPGRGA
jgi:hypothetical protein